MKVNKLSVIFAVFLFFSQSLLAQTVTKVKDPYLLLRIDNKIKVQKGDILYIYRTSNQGTPEVVAKVNVIAVRTNFCAVKIIKKSDKYQILPGDMVKKPTQNIVKPNEEKVFKVSQKGEKEHKTILSSPLLFPKQRIISYSTFTSGLIISGIGYFYYDQAGITSSQTCSTKSEYDRLVNLTQKYDKRANSCFYIGGGLIVFAVVHYFLTNGSSRTANTFVYNFTPVATPTYSGINITIPL